MTALAITITDAGRAAVVNAQANGLGPILISQIALGSGKYSPLASQTALVAEIKRLATFGGDVVAPDTIHVTITDDTADSYNLSEIGLYTDTGVLFAVYSQATDITQKTAQQIMLIAADIVLSSLPAGSVTIGDTDFMLPPATTSVAGIVELADNAEIDAGTDTARAVTPAGLARRINTRAPLSHTHTIANVTGLQTALDLAYIHQSDLPSGIDLDTVIDTGWYHQNSNAGASSGANYPTALAGLLRVHADGAMVYQTYQDYTGTGLWFRARYNTLWSSWKRTLDGSRTITAGNGLTGGGDLSANRSLTLGTPGTCSGATSNGVTAESHTHQITAATTSVAGAVELADYAEIDTGTDTARAVTPAGLARRINTRAQLSHTHDDRYYTEAEVNALLAGKSSTGHIHDDRYFTEAEVNALLAGKSGTGHIHDDRYYTEAEVTALLAGKAAADYEYLWVQIWSGAAQTLDLPALWGDGIYRTEASNGVRTSIITGDGTTGNATAGGTYAYGRDVWNSVVKVWALKKL